MKKLSSFKKNTGLLIRIDDIAAHMKWDLIQKCEILFDELNIKPLLGVIPNNKDKEFLKYEKKDDFWHKVRAWQSKGWEISMHGFDHVYNADTMKKDFFGYGGKSEFYGHSFDHQKKRIEEGLKIFKKEKVNGVIKLKLYKGNITIESRITNSKAYSMKKVSFEENKSFNKSNVEKFISFHKKKLKNY